MSESPSSSSCSISSNQLIKAGTVLLLLASDMSLSVVLSKLFSESSFVFPLYVTMLHAVLSCLLSALVLRTRVEGHTLPHIQPLQANWENTLKVLSQALALALNVSLFNISLRYISLALSMTARSTVPLFVVLLSCLLYRQKRGVGVWLCVLGITAGMAASVYHNPQFQLLGFGLALGSALTEALALVLAEYIMLSAKLDALNLLYYSALPSAGFIFPFFVALEGSAVVHYVSQHFWVNIFIVCSTSLLAFLFNLSRYQLMRLTSSIYTSTVQNIKVVLLVIVSEIVFYSSSPKLSLLNQLGIVLSLCSFLYLTFLGFSEDSYALGLTRSSVSDFKQRLKWLLRNNQFELLDVLSDGEQRFTIEDEEEEEEMESGMVFIVEDDDEEKEEHCCTTDASDEEEGETTPTDMS